MEQEGKSFRDYLDMVVRRKFLIAIPAVLISIAASTVALLLPAAYESQATISIERQQIPSNMVNSTVTTYADEEINVIQRKIMSMDNILEIIDKYGLYPEERSEKTSIDLVGEFREGAKVRLVSADVTDPKSGRSREAVIAFKILFIYSVPEVAQQVVNELVSRFLSEYAKTRAETTSETTRFLSEEADKAKREMQKMEVELAAFKQKYKDSLPEMLNVNMSKIDRLTSRIGEIDSSRKALDEKLTYLRIELAQISPLVTENGLSPKQQLKSAKAELTTKLRTYTDSHPDILRLRDHIKILEQEVADEEALLAKGTEATNPAYEKLQNEINFAEEEMKTLDANRQSLLGKIESLEEQISKVPEVEQGYTELIRDYESVSSRYTEMVNKKMRAELAQTLEEEQKGAGFSLLEPARLPLKPSEPDRPKIFLMGFILALGAGGGLAFLVETMDKSIRGYEAFTAIAKVPPIAVIPYIANQEDINKRRRRLITSLVTIVVLIAGIVISVHLFVMPLDLLWLKLTSMVGA